MDMKQLEIFIRVAELRSFSKAAEVMDLSQSVLSRQVKLLEIEVGRHLLYRNGRGVSLTEPGKRFMAHGIGILRQFEAAKQEAIDDQESPAGKIILGLPPQIGSFLTTPLVEKFYKQYPKATINIAEGPTASIYEWLVLGRLDVGLLNNPPLSPQLEYEYVSSEDLSLIGSVAHHKSMPATMKMQNLSKFPLILPCRPHVIRNLVDDACGRLGIKLDIAYEIDSIAAILDLVKQGFAYGLLPTNTIARLTEKRKHQVARIVSPAITNQLFIGTSSQRPLSKLARLTIDLIKVEIKTSNLSARR